MREILFKGKRTSDGKWIFGSLAIWKSGKVEIVHEDDREGVIDFQRINPDTIGQYTGLKDKNDVKIFEGDIIRTYDKDGEPWKCAPVVFEGSSFGIGNHCPCVTIDLEFNAEVIGNIHDNPSLLEPSNTTNNK